VGFVVGKVALGQVFSEYFDFHCPTLIPPTAPYPLIILSSTLYNFDTDVVVKERT
jgi:hypothetical protein